MPSPGSVRNTPIPRSWRMGLLYLVYELQHQLEKKLLWDAPARLGGFHRLEVLFGVLVMYFGVHIGPPSIWASHLSKFEKRMPNALRKKLTPQFRDQAAFRFWPTYH